MKRERSGAFGVIVDVHSGSVGIAIVESRAEEPAPKILYANREYLRIGKHSDTDGLIRAMRHALFAATLHLTEHGLPILRSIDSRARVGRILLVCGSPWARTITRFIHLEDKEPFSVTKERVRALVDEAEKRDREELGTSGVLKELNVELVERAIVHTAVNGYLVADPYGKRATELSLTHLSGLIPRAILDAIEDIEHKVLTHTSRSSHTFALILFCILRDLHPHTKSALMVDISGEATEFGVIQDEVLQETIIAPYGAHTFVRELSKALNTFPEEATHHLAEYGKGGGTAAVKEAIERVAVEYRKELNGALADLRSRYVLPDHTFLIAHRDLGHAFHRIFDSSKEANAAGAARTITLLNDHAALHLPEREEGATSDIFFAVEARFFHKLHGCGEIEE